MAEFKVASADASLAQKTMTWVDNRFPATKLFKEHMSEYYAPKNFNIWYVFGSLSLQTCTGAATYKLPVRTATLSYDWENWHEFVQYCIKRNWAGIENLSGVY